MKTYKKRNRRMKLAERLGLIKRLVKCSTHGETEGYVACKCVADGLRRPVFVEHPGESHPTLGSILCSECAAEGGGLKRDIPTERLVLVCGLCARDRGINKVKVNIQ